MASMTMTAASVLAGSALARHPSAAQRRGLIVVAKASNGSQAGRVSVEMKESNNGRRDLVFAAAAAAMFSVARVAMADEEPERGTPEAKKKYAPICVTMPTARICHKIK